MAEEFEGDLVDAVFWGADLSGAQFRDVNLRGATVTHAWVVDVEVDAFVDRLVVNGVDVTAHVNQHDRWYPLRTVLGAADPQRMRDGWALLREAWDGALDRGRQLPDTAIHASVDGEWSFVQTLRHLVFAMDKWFTVPILDGGFAALGLPNTGSFEFPFAGLDLAATPTLDEVLSVRVAQQILFGDHLTAITSEDLVRNVEVPENGPHLVRDCIATVLEEEFWHFRYADRDLAALESAI